MTTASASIPLPARLATRKSSNRKIRKTTLTLDGSGSWGDFKSHVPDSSDAYTYGYALTQLRRGDIGKFLLTFYSSMAYGMDRDTYSAVEITRITNGINELTLPHTYSNTQQLRMVRMMLVKEEGDDLLLAFATPRAWLTGTNRIAVKRAPTIYGLISYTLAADANAKKVRAIVEPIANHSGQYPRRVRLRVHSGIGELGDVLVNGKKYGHIDHEILELDGSMLRQRIEIVANLSMANY